jgi:ParB family transcriptional regulator, chromosome partitioning protein
MKPRRLGRGLDFLLSAPEQKEPEAGVESIEIASIQSNPWQPRTRFEEEQLENLARSISRHGVIQPVVVRKLADGRFQLVAGERRLLAAKRSGLDRIPAVVRALEDGEMLVVALVENIQREDLGAVERARAFKRLTDEHGLSHQEIADASGLARPTVSNALRLLELDEASIAALERGDITEGHARALLAEPDVEARKRLLGRMNLERLSVRSVEEEVKIKDRKGSPKLRRRGTADARMLERQLAEALGLKVRIEERGAGGRVVIHYSTLADFDRAFEKIVGKPPKEFEEGAVA